MIKSRKSSVNVVLLFLLVSLLFSGCNITPESMAALTDAIRGGYYLTNGSTYIGFIYFGDKVWAAEATAAGIQAVKQTTSQNALLIIDELRATTGWRSVKWAAIPEVVRRASMTRLFRYSRLGIIPAIPAMNVDSWEQHIPTPEIRTQ